MSLDRKLITTLIPNLGLFLRYASTITVPSGIDFATIVSEILCFTFKNPEASKWTFYDFKQISTRFGIEQN